MTLPYIVDDDTDISIDVGIRLLQVLVNVMRTYEALTKRNVGSSIQQLHIMSVLFTFCLTCQFTVRPQLSNVCFVSESYVRYVSACNNGRSFHVATY